jgi:uncharacterized DUF497 family protein
MKISFEWDDDKDAANQAKHDVSFTLACRVFFDPNRIEKYDYRQDYGEDRWITIGHADIALLFVAYTIRGEADEIIRLISARKANEQERRAYHKTRA